MLITSSFPELQGAQNIMYKENDIPGVKVVRDEKKEWLPVRVTRKGKEFLVHEPSRHKTIHI